MIALIGICLPLIDGLQVNEVLYNPIGADAGKEFIELSRESNETGDLSNYTVGDRSRNNTLTLKQFSNTTLMLIVREDFNLTIATMSQNVTIYTAKELGNGLNNDGDTIWLYNREKQPILIFSYNDLVPEGRSLEFNGNQYLSSTIENGTPGKENSVILKNQEENRENATISTNKNITTITTTSASLPGEGNPCELMIMTDHEEYTEGETMVISFNVTQPFDTIEYDIENSEGDILKTPRMTKNLKSKTWKTKIDHSQNENIVFIHAMLSSENCSNEQIKKVTITTLHNSTREKEGKQKEKNNAKKESTLESIHVSLGNDQLARFGEPLTVQLIQPTREDKLIENTLIEKPTTIVIKKQKTILLRYRATSGKKTLVIPLPENCDNIFEEGIYEVSIEGQQRVRQSMPVYNNKHCVVNEKSMSQNKKVNNSDTSKASQITIEVITEVTTNHTNAPPEVYDTKEKGEDTTMSREQTKIIPSRLSPSNTPHEIVWYSGVSLGIVGLLVMMKRQLKQQRQQLHAKANDNHAEEN